MLPSDHYIHPVASLVDGIGQACAHVAERRDRVVLLGAVPDSPETDYGWIEVAPSLNGPQTTKQPAPALGRTFVPREAARGSRPQTVRIGRGLLEHADLRRSSDDVVAIGPSRGAGADGCIRPLRDLAGVPADAAARGDG